MLRLKAHNLRKGFGIKTGAADEGSVDVRLRHEPCDIGSVDRTAVEDSHAVGCSTPPLVGDHATAEDLLQETMLKIARGLPGFIGHQF